MLALCLAACLGGPSATSQPAPTALEVLNEWIQAVQRHVVGEQDDSVGRLASWSNEELEGLRPYVEALVGFDARDEAARKRHTLVTLAERFSVRELVPSLGEIGRFRKRAVMLHTDVALLSSRVERVVAPTPRRQKSWLQREEAEKRVLLRTDDGRVDSFELASLHWEYAMGILDVVRAEDPLDPVVPLWYRAVAAYLASEYRFGDAVPHFARARRALGDDAGLLYSEACLQETLGAPRVQEFVRRTVLANGLSIRDVSSPERHLSRAESLLREVLALQSQSIDARLRLARVLTVQGRSAEAAVELEMLSGRSGLDARQRYFLYLFQGDAAQLLQLHDEARTSFKLAVELFPRAQSARFALSYALRLAGESTAAIDVLMPVLNDRQPDREGNDPWWDYHTCDAVYLGELLEELRAPLRAPH